MTVSAVVVAHGAPDLLSGCLSSLRGEVDEVLVVDNDDGRGAAIAEDFGMRFVHAENRGFGAAQNLGLRHTSGEFVLIMNPDARLVPGAIDKGLRLLRASGKAGAVQGVCRSLDSRPERSQGGPLGPIHLWGRAAGMRALQRTRVGRRLGHALPATRDHIDRIPEKVEPVLSLSATALLVRRAAFDEVGGFDEAFFMYGEDLDLCRRLTTSGWELLAAPWEWAVHQGGGSFPDSWAREVEWWRGTLLYSAKWWTGGAWRLALGAACARAVTAFPRSPRSALAILMAAKDRRGYRISGRG